jgi:dUTP pyrophosphatase
MNNIQEIERMLLKSLDPTSGYSTEDFIAQYGNPNQIITDEMEVYKVNINFVNKSNNQNPEYATKGSAGFDLRANLEAPVLLYPGEYQIIPTGLYFELPENYEIQIRSRSGLAANYGVAVLNSPGTIDSDYRGEIKIILINHGKTNFRVEHGDRIAQGVIANTVTNFINLNNITEISEETERGSGGFGSTGVK